MGESMRADKRTLHADVAEALARIRGFSSSIPTTIDGPAAPDRSTPATSSSLSSTDWDLHPSDPLNQLLVQSEPLDSAEQQRLLAQYDDAEMRVVYIILQSPSGSQILAVLLANQTGDPEKQRTAVSEFRSELREMAFEPEPTVLANMMARIPVDRITRARFVEQVCARVGTASCPSGGDPAWQVAFRNRYERMCDLRGKLIERNLRLIPWLVSRRRERDVAMGRRDLFLAGITGLMRGIAYFDLARGNQFSTYARWWIETRVERTTHVLVPLQRIPYNLYKIRARLLSARKALWETLGHEPTLSELGTSCSMDEESIAMVFARLTPPRLPDRIKTPRGDFVGDALYDERWITPVQVEARRRLSEIIYAAIERLNDQRRDILIRRFGIGGGKGMILRQLGDSYGVTRERIRQIEERALGDIEPLLRREAAQLLPCWFDQVPATSATKLMAPTSSDDGGGNLR